MVNPDEFQLHDWASLEFGHIEGQVETPPNMPEAHGVGFVIRANVDTDHASDTVMQQLHTGFIIYLNCSSIYWWSRKQNSVTLLYITRLGMLCEESMYVYGDNQSILVNTTILDSTLKKKSQCIAYHFIGMELLEMSGV